MRNGVRVHKAGRTAGALVVVEASQGSTVQASPQARAWVPPIETRFMSPDLRAKSGGHGISSVLISKIVYPNARLAKSEKMAELHSPRAAALLLAGLWSHACLDAAGAFGPDGNLLWKFKTGANIASSPAVADGVRKTNLTPRPRPRPRAARARLPARPFPGRTGGVGGGDRVCCKSTCAHARSPLSTHTCTITNSQWPTLLLCLVLTLSLSLPLCLSASLPLYLSISLSL